MKTEIEIGYQVGDTFWSIYENKVCERVVTRIQVEMWEKRVDVLYLCGLDTIKINKMFNTKELLIGSL